MSQVDNYLRILNQEHISKDENGNLIESHFNTKAIIVIGRKYDNISSSDFHSWELKFESLNKSFRHINNDLWSFFWTIN